MYEELEKFTNLSGMYEERRRKDKRKNLKQTNKNAIERPLEISRVSKCDTSGIFSMSVRFEGVVKPLESLGDVICFLFRI